MNIEFSNISTSLFFSFNFWIRESIDSTSWIAAISGVSKRVNMEAMGAWTQSHYSTFHMGHPCIVI